MPPILKSGTCWKCGTELTPLDYGRQDSCRRCGLSTHVCLNCIHHDRAYNNECRESQAERVVDKERSNFCDYFSPKSSTTPPGPSPQDAARAAAEALFKKK